MYGKVVETPQTETTPFHPRSPYACAKVFSYWQTVNYREAYNMFAVNGILFNHESPRRGETFVTRKITRAATRIKEGLQDKLFLGNLDAKRDWGFAGDYVEAMWMMLQAKEPQDFVVATGETHSVREFLDEVFGHLGLDWNKYVEVDPRYFRPAEVDLLLGDATQGPQGAGLDAAGDVQGPGEDDDRRRLEAGEARARRPRPQRRAVARRAQWARHMGALISPADTSIPAPVRPPHIHRWARRHPFATIIACLVVFVLLLRLAWGWYLSRQLAARLNEIRATGEPATVKDVVFEPVADGDNAWLGFMRGNGAVARRLSPRGSMLEYPHYPPYGPRWETLAEGSEKANARAFQLARQARAMRGAAPRFVCELLHERRKRGSQRSPDVGQHARRRRDVRPPPRRRR